MFDFAAQDSYTGRVEGGCVDLSSLLFSEHGRKTGAQLPGRFIGKGDCKNLPRTGRIFRQQAAEDGVVLNPALLGLFQPGKIILPDPEGNRSAAVAGAEKEKVGDSVDEDGGLAAAGTGQNKQRPFGG